MTADVTGWVHFAVLKRLKSETRLSFLPNGSSEQFGEVREIPQTEMTPFYLALTVLRKFLRMRLRGIIVNHMGYLLAQVFFSTMRAPEEVWSL